MRLSVDRINQDSPYWVVQLDDMLFRFNTENGVTYRVGFYKDKYLAKDGIYHFFIANVNNDFAPRDLKVFKVISLVLEEFFRQEEPVMLYICDPKDHRENIRSRLYERWFNNYANQDELTLHKADIDFDGYIVYAGMILRKDHPLYNEVIASFDDFVKEAPTIMHITPKP